MLTSFFGKSNPINYLILGILVFAAYFLKIFIVEEMTVNPSSVFSHLIYATMTAFSMLLLDFTIRKNSLTKNNTYGIFLFSCFLIAFPSIFMDNQSLLAGIFLMLAFRRILSFRTNKNLEKKILDAALWITLASFFYFWSMLFFSVLYFALIQKSETNYKQLLIPIIGFLGMLILATTFYFITANSFGWFSTWKTPISRDFSAYNFGDVLLPTSVIFTFLIWTGLSRFFKLSVMPKKEKPTTLILLVALVVTVFISLASPLKTGSELFFILGPLAIIITNYIENIDEFWFKEVLLWLALLLPVIVFVL